MEFHSRHSPAALRARLSDRANPNTVSQNLSRELIHWTWRGEGGFTLSIPGRFGLHFVGRIVPEGTGSLIRGAFGPTPLGQGLLLAAFALLWLLYAPTLSGAFSFRWGGLLRLLLGTGIGYPLLHFGPPLYYGESRRNMLSFLETLLA